MGFSIRYSHGYSPTLFDYSFGVDFDIKTVTGELLVHRMKDTLHITAFGAEYDFLVNYGFFRNNGEKGVCRTVDYNQIVAMLAAFKKNQYTYYVA